MFEEIKHKEVHHNKSPVIKQIVKLKKAMKKKAPQKAVKGKNVSKYAINNDGSDEEMDELDASTVGILDEVQPKRINHV